MTPADQISALRPFGYSEREASFVALAAMHSGYFLRRQISSTYGKPADELCKKVLARGHASAAVYSGNTHVFHLKDKRLYRALDQENNRHRRAVDPCRLAVKLMGLDYVLLHDGYRFLPTEEEKMEYFSDVRSLPPAALPSTTYGAKDRSSRTRRYFVDKFPVRIGADDSVAFVYLDDGMFTAPGFPSWLGQYAALIRTLDKSEIVYVSGSADAFRRAKAQFEAQFPETAPALTAEFLRYCELRKEIETTGAGGRTQEALDKFRGMSRRYSEATSQRMYADWKAGSTPIQASQKTQLTSFALPFEYSRFGVARASE
jgi:hypothetical protein